MKRKFGVDDTEYPHETWEEHLIRTALEAEAYSEKHGYLTIEEVEAAMTKHKQAFLNRIKKPFKQN